MNLEQLIEKIKEYTSFSDIPLDELTSIQENFEQIDETSKKKLSKLYKDVNKEIMKGGKLSFKKVEEDLSKDVLDNYVTSKSSKTIEKPKSFKETKNKDLTKEDIEALDELSKQTLGNYVGKAAKEASTNTRAAMDSYDNKDLKAKYKAKADKRRSGIDKATDRLLTKEEKTEEKSVLESAVDTLRPNGAPGETNTGALADLVSKIPYMKIEDISRIKEVLDQIGKEADCIPANAASQNQATLKMKEDIESIFNGEELSEEFIKKATNLFESAILLKVSEEIVTYKAKLDTIFEETMDEYFTEMESRLETYADFTANHFMKENSIAIENELTNEISVKFINGLKELFKENYIDIPEEKKDFVSELETKVKELEESLDVVIQDNKELENIIEKYNKDSVLNKLVLNLNEQDATKLKTLAEAIEFNNIDTFSQKIEYLKQKITEKAPVKSNILNEEFNGETDITEEVIDPQMKTWINALDKLSANR